MRNEFITFDFEIANKNLTSACSLGIVHVKNFEIKETHKWLIKPPELLFDKNISEMTRLCENDLLNCPQFDCLWEEINEHLNNNIVVAHNVFFDISVLKNVLDNYDLSYPNLDYVCSIAISKKVWGISRFTLESVAKHLNINYQKHDSLEDALVCAKIVIEAGKELGINNFDNLLKKLHLTINNIFNVRNVQKTFFVRFPKIRAKDITPENICMDYDNPFYGKEIVFTGELESMSRETAMQKVADIGAIIHDTVRRSTNILVDGEDGYISGKMKKVLDLKSKGFPIEIIKEESFLRLINNK